MNLKRRYRLYHLTDPKAADSILAAACQVKGVKEITISEDLQKMNVVAEKEELSPAMDRIVNICRNISCDCEIQYLFS